MSKHVYFAVFHPEAGGRYSVTFPDVPGAISEGDNFADALSNARDALEALLDSLVEDGEALPNSTNPEILYETNSNAILSAVEAETQAKTVRVNVSLDERLLAQIDRAAEHGGYTRSGFFVQAAKRVLEEQSSARPSIAVRGATTERDDQEMTLGRLSVGLKPAVYATKSNLSRDVATVMYLDPISFPDSFFGAGEETSTSFVGPHEGDGVSLIFAGDRAFKYFRGNPRAEAVAATPQARKPS